MILLALIAIPLYAKNGYTIRNSKSGFCSRHLSFMKIFLQRSFLVFVCGLLWVGTVVAATTQTPSSLTTLPANTCLTPKTTLPSNNPAYSSSNPHTRLWNLQNADILSVINAISRETGKNFIVDPRVQGKVTLVSSKPMDANEIYQVFLAVLQTHGFSAVPSGNIIKIVPENDAKQQQTPIADAANPGQGDEVVVRVIPVTNIPSEQLLPIIRPMLPQPNDVSAYSPTNSIIVSGRASKVSSIADLIHKIDTENSSNMQVIPLHHATASDLVTEINNLQANNRLGSGVGSLSLVADDRTNSIVISGDQASRIRIQGIIANLDHDDPCSSHEGNTQVIYLRYLKAKDLVPILRGIASNTTGDTTPASDSNSDDSNKQKQPVYTDAPRYIVLNQPKQCDTAPKTNSQQGGDKHVSIQAEPNTNAIIISAPPAIMQSIKAIVAQLDMRPNQVLVEAIIVEIDEAKLEKLGVEWGTSSEAGSPNDGSPFSTLTGGLGIGFINRGNIRVLVSALGTDTSSNILATPSLVVLDNQKANIKVGKKVPTTTGSYPSNSAGSSVEPFTTTDYKDVVLSLNVTPQITRDNTVKLHIEQGNDTMAAQTGVSGNPIFNTTLIKTDVLVRSNQILVLGGLLNNDLEGRTTHVPIVSKIPLIGQLFRSKDNSLEKKNLVVFLRPVIMSNDCDNEQVTAPRYDDARLAELRVHYTEGEARTFGERPVIPRRKNIQLPKPFDCKQ